MLIAFILSVLCLLGGGVFFWLNLNSPVQTPYPAILVPVGIVLLAVCFGGLLF